MTGIYYYKLVSPYPDDVTKNCKLTINEIDSNFFNLKSADIKEATFDGDTLTLHLVRNDGNMIDVDLSEYLSGVTRDFSVSFDDCEGDLIFKYNGDTHVVGKFLTEKNFKASAMTEVITDGTVVGKGIDGSPLGINRAMETGFYKPAKGIIDITTGEEMPICKELGDRYITIEEIDDYGKLYNYFGVEQIESGLTGEWRIPSKKDWDGVLNAIEPCDEYRTHNRYDCHIELGKYAGQKLKTADKWRHDVTGTSGYYVEDEDEPKEKECPSEGVNEYGFSVYPAGYGIDKNKNLLYFGEEAVFWTKTKTSPIGDYYVKVFKYDASGVFQAAECPYNFYSLRLVKDYDGSNFRETEYINGKLYPCVLMPTLNEDCEHGYQIWTSVNVDFGRNEGVSTDNFIRFEDYDVPEPLYPTIRRKVYVMNYWNGNQWEKKILSEGDTVSIAKSFSGDPDSTCEYKILNVDGELTINSVDEIIQRLVGNPFDDKIAELSAAIDTEIEERISGDDALSGEIDTLRSELKEEISARTEADEVLSGDIETLRSELEDEVSARTEADDKIWSAIGEISGGTDEKIDELSAKVETEIQERIAADEELSDRIDDVYGNVLSGGTYSLNVADGVEIPSFSGNNNVIIVVDSNYGTF